MSVSHKRTLRFEQSINLFLCSTELQPQPDQSKMPTLYSSILVAFFLCSGVQVGNSGRRWCWMCRREKADEKKPQANRNNNTNTYNAYSFPIVDNKFNIYDRRRVIDCWGVHACFAGTTDAHWILFFFFLHENGLSFVELCFFVICSKRNENEISTNEDRLNSDQWRWALINNRRHSAFEVLKEKEGKWMSSASARLWCVCVLGVSIWILQIVVYEFYYLSVSGRCLALSISRCIQEMVALIHAGRPWDT